MDAIRILRHSSRRLLSQVLKADRLQFTYRAARLRDQSQLGGAALTEKSSKSQRPRPEREAINVIAPEKKHSRIVANFAGSALTETLFSSPKRMLGRDARNVTDPKKKRAHIVKERRVRP